MNPSKARILSSIIGVIMVISFVKPIIASVLLEILGATLWIKGDEYIA